MTSATDGDGGWITIYPCYINSNRTLRRGRLVPKSKAVADPRWQEIKEVLETIKGMRVQEEPDKVHPRELDKEIPAFRGRIKYIPPANDQKYVKRKDVLQFLGETIPKLKSRSKTHQANNFDQGAQAAAGKKKKSRK